MADEWYKKYKRIDGDWVRPEWYENEDMDTWFRAHIGYTPVKINKRGSDFTVTFTTSHDIEVYGDGFYDDSFYVEYGQDYASPWNHEGVVSGVWDEQWYGTWLNEFEVPVGNTFRTTNSVEYYELEDGSQGSTGLYSTVDYSYTVPSPKRPNPPKISFDGTKFTASTNGFTTWTRDGDSTQIGTETPTFYKLEIKYTIGSGAQKSKTISLDMTSTNQTVNSIISDTINDDVTYSARVVAKWHGVTVYSQYCPNKTYVAASSGQDAYVNVNGAFKPADGYVKVNGAWKPAELYVKVNGTWKKAKV